MTDSASQVLPYKPFSSALEGVFWVFWVFLLAESDFVESVWAETMFRAESGPVDIIFSAETDFSVSAFSAETVTALSAFCVGRF